MNTFQFDHPRGRFEITFDPDRPDFPWIGKFNGEVTVEADRADTALFALQRKHLREPAEIIDFHKAVEAIRQKS
jgi:hypothetical protein